MTGTHDRIEALIGRIAAARDIAAAGGRVDLAGMEDQVDAVCQSVRDPGHRADRRIRSGLERMLADLNALEAELTQRRDAMTGETGPAVAPQAAAAAYGKTKR